MDVIHLYPPPPYGLCQALVMIMV